MDRIEESFTRVNLCCFLLCLLPLDLFLPIDVILLSDSYDLHLGLIQLTLPLHRVIYLSPFEALELLKIRLIIRPNNPIISPIIGFKLEVLPLSLIFFVQIARISLPLFLQFLPYLVSPEYIDIIPAN